MVHALNVLREAFTNKLRGAIGANLARYQQDRPWVAEFASGSKWEVETDLVPAEPLQLLLPGGDDLKDFENAVSMHRSLPNLSPRVARDPRLWARLTHVELWVYMRKRWAVERYLADKSRAERFILERYFVARNESRALLRNGAARLWWCAKLSHDPVRSDPYELTRILLSKLDITQNLLENSIGRAPGVVHGFLEFLRENPKLLAGGDENRRKIRGLVRFLNLTGGVRVLDCLSKEEVIAMLRDEVPRPAA